MAYRFDGGEGAVTCDKCNVIFDGRISFQEYVEAYGTGPDYCWKHKDLRPSKKDEDSCCEEEESSV